ncbi:uncharacterized protein FIBRA_02693 [Fibroporia radiculosa]|uniref:Velvet domain-containing protein n=1 Tax=Fibroporia radiculosa TaxID=599839 RepID=J4GN18_9APHY|nr:uncharacterized protein FIBRA_02693 [Fibroporia radiculosa]CCM00655.1 predicted protein [Fibroporia radiculosa]
MAPVRQDDPPQSWGHWVGRKHYSLEVVQHPLRARMCGFGDKDRRPLAPAAVAKMVVRREDGSIVDVDEIDISFFLVTVDLWSGDGKSEMNLVLHPTSADRYVPANTPKSKRRGTNANTASSSAQRPTRPSPSPAPASATAPAPAPAPASSPAQYSQQSNEITPYMAPSTSGYSSQAYSYPNAPAPLPESPGYQSQPMSNYSTSSDAPPGWGYPPPPTSMERVSQYPPPSALPPIHSAARSGSASNNGPAPVVSYNSASGSGTGTAEGWHLENPGREDTEAISYRTWPQEGSYPPIDNNGASYSSTTIDPSLRGSSSNSEMRDNSYAPLAPTSPADTYAQNRYPQDPYPPMPQQPPDGSAYHPPASYPPQQSEQPPPSQYQEAQYGQDPTPPSTIPPLPRHTYTRTLVGPLSANACRLLDEHRKPGIFFLFQDLSIRTEGLSLPANPPVRMGSAYRDFPGTYYAFCAGTFRLRLRLMNVGAPPAPETRSTQVHTGVSPILAQTFTEPFIVYSAKRFPGVPDTTALSIALGNQGQKLPLRNRNGSAKQSRKRQRSGSDVSGDESDDA